MDSQGSKSSRLVTRARRRSEFVLLQFLADFLAVLSGLVFSYWFRFHAGLIPPAGGWDSLHYLRQLPWAVALWLLAIYLTGNYQNHPQVISFNRARRLLKASLLAIVLIIAKNYFMRDQDLARVLYPIAVVFVTSALIFYRALLQRVVVRFFVGRGLPRSRILIVGLGPTAFRLAARVKRHPEYAYELAGFVAEDESKRNLRIGGAPILGTLSELREILRTGNIQDVFLARSDLERDSLLGLFMDSEMAAVRVHVVPTLAEMMRSRVYYDEIAGVPLYRFLETPQSGINVALKRAFDLALSASALFVLWPLLLVIGFLVRRQSPGPALYRQVRVGLDGFEFTMLKFRTMPEDVECSGPGWGGQEDPRATRLGRFLRRWNLDELPQLWNVLKGEMSLVGPRPERPVFVERFRGQFPFYMSRHKVRAGMTGWAQVHGFRGDTSISQRVRYDLYYIENWSLWLDIKILLMTFFRGPRRARPVTPPPVPPRTAARPESKSPEEVSCPQNRKPVLSTTKQPG